MLRVNSHSSGKYFTFFAVADYHNGIFITGKVFFHKCRLLKFILNEFYLFFQCFRIFSNTVFIDAACDALDCDDHVRIDMREGADGKLRIMEVNGIPGLKPVKSWSPQIFSLYHPEGDTYNELIGTIVKCALERANA